MGQTVVGYDIMALKLVLALGACSALARVTYPSRHVRRVRGPHRRVGVREMKPVITRASGGTWRRVSGLLDLKFLGLVDLRSWKTLVLSVF